MKNSFNIITPFKAVVNNVSIHNETAYKFLCNILPKITDKFNVVLNDESIISAVDDTFSDTSLSEFELDRCINVAIHDVERFDQYKDFIFDSEDELENFFEHVNNTMSVYNGDFQLTEDDLTLTF